ncbi:hypothetical protein [Mesorhizobium sp. M0802]|uniref:hypothetical protein n=1 Tax=Mesorhizobium sp. M0802 TaxID=2957001 RepID=UPI00333DAA6B
MPNRAASTSRHFNFHIPDDVTDAIVGYIDCSAPGRIISTFAAVQWVRDKVPDCEMSDDQLERCAVLAAVDEGLAVHFDRRGRQPAPFSSLSRSHWHLVPIWQIKVRPRLATPIRTVIVRRLPIRQDSMEFRP